MKTVPEWVKVKAAALLGVGTTSVTWEHVGEVLDVAIKVGQLGVAVVTVIYIFTKWRKLRRDRKPK